MSVALLRYFERWAHLYPCLIKFVFESSLKMCFWFFFSFLALKSFFCGEILIPRPSGVDKYLLFWLLLAVFFSFFFLRVLLPVLLVAVHDGCVVGPHLSLPGGGPAGGRGHVRLGTPVEFGLVVLEKGGEGGLKRKGEKRVLAVD